jgi:hypothetical protein
VELRLVVAQLEILVATQPLEVLCLMAVVEAVVLVVPLGLLAGLVAVAQTLLLEAQQLLIKDLLAGLLLGQHREVVVAELERLETQTGQHSVATVFHLQLQEAL